MDKLTQQLKADALLIDAEVSPELDRRITASLSGIRPEVADAPAVPRSQPAFWWASSLTGVAATLTIIAVINSHSQSEAVPEVRAVQTSPVIELTTPLVDWKAESAMLTRPLQDELDKLQSDIKKAEKLVKQDIGL
jgi:hypothetical protein